eukprot:gene861-1676_t
MESKNIPRGVPSVTYLRVLSNDNKQIKDDITTDGNSVYISQPGQPVNRYEVAQVLERDISDHDVCESTVGEESGSGMGALLNPVTAFVHDAVTTLIFIIGSKKTKKWQFLNSVFLPFLADELFLSLNDKTDEAVGFHEVDLKLSAFEVQDEIVTDLLLPVNRGLNICNTVYEGVVVGNLHKESIDGEDSLKRTLEHICSNRSTAVFDMELVQKEGGGREGVKTSRSRLLVVDIPAIDGLLPLTSSASAVESHTLHKGMVCQGELEASRKTLEMMSTLSNVTHYPVGGRGMSEVVLGLLCKYRTMILHIQDELEYVKASQSSTSNTQVNSTSRRPKKVTDLQQELTQTILSHNTSQQDAARLYEMLELLKQKYNTLIDMKTKQGEELLKSEEDKLTLAKTIVELKLKYGHEQEDAEREKFELSSNLLSAKSDICELESQLEDVHTEISNKNQEIQKLEKQLKTEKELSIANISVKSQLEKESERNLDIGAELLTLVNQKEALHHKCVELQSAVKDLSSKLKICQDSMQGDGNSNEKLTIELKRVTDDLSSAVRDKIEAELNLKAMKVEMDKGKLEFDKMANEFLRDRDEAFNRAKRASENELNRIRSEHEDLLLQLRRSQRFIRDIEKDLKRTRGDLEETLRDKNELETEITNLRQFYRSKLSAIIGDTVDTPVGSDLQTEGSAAVSQPPDVLQELAATYVDGEKKLLRTSEKLKSRADMFRKAFRVLYSKYSEVLDIIQDNVPSMIPKEIVTEDYLMTSEGLQLTPRDADRDSKKSSQLRARNEEEALSEQRTQNMIASYVLKLVSFVLKLVSYVLKLVSYALKLVSYVLKLVSYALKLTRIAGVVSTYKRNLEKAQNEKEVLLKEIEVLKESNLQLERQSGSSEQILALEKRVLKDIEDVKGRQDSEAHKKPLQMIALQAQKQLDDDNKELRLRLALKEKELSQERSDRDREREQAKTALEAAQTSTSSSTSTSTVHTVNSDVKAQKQLDDDNKELRLRLALKEKELSQERSDRDREREQARIALEAAQTSTSSSTSTVHTVNIDVQSQSALLEQYRELEKKNVQLTSKFASIEEELKNYKTYMKDTVTQYKKQVQALKSQLQKAGATVTTATDV